MSVDSELRALLRRAGGNYVLVPRNVFDQLRQHVEIIARGAVAELEQAHSYMLEHASTTQLNPDLAYGMIGNYVNAKVTVSEAQRLVNLHNQLLNSLDSCEVV